MKRVILFLVLLSIVTLSTMGQVDIRLVNKAQQGDPAAMVRLGEYYEMGAGVPVDSALALQWFQRAADAGYADGAMEISAYYLRGTLLPKDTARCLSIRREWAEKGNPNAMTYLASCYLRGIGVEADTAKAIGMLNQAAKLKSAKAYLLLSEMYGETGTYEAYGIKHDVKKEVEYITKAYKADAVSAAVYMAKAYLDNNDSRQAAKWVEIGCKEGNPEAKAIKAIMLANGVGYTQDEAQAMSILDELIGKYHNLDVAQMWAGNLYMNACDTNLRNSDKALAIWREGCRLGFVSCMNALANWYKQQGDHESENRLLRQATSSQTACYGVDKSCHNLAINLWTGMGCDTNREEALKWALRGTHKFHDAKCALTAGLMYEEMGDAVHAAMYYAKSYQLGNPEGMIYQGKLYARYDNNKQAMASFQQMVDDGHIVGYFWLVEMYGYMGDSINAIKMMQIGDAKGCMECSELLGDVYTNGYYGITPDYNRAVKYYKRSTSPRSKYMLALIYSNNLVGKNEEKNAATAMEYLLQSADERYADALYSLGECYELGRNVDSIDYEKALDCYLLLAGIDNSMGYLKLGIYYENGLGGLSVNKTKAALYYQMAIDKGNSEAMCYLGDLYREGFDAIPADKAKAFEYYMHAYQAGSEYNPYGAYQVARSYMEGCGVNVDTAAAMPYLNQAAEGGVGKASYMIADMYRDGTGGLVANNDSAWAYYLQAHRNGYGEGTYIVGTALMAAGETDAGIQMLLTAVKAGSTRALVSLAGCLQDGIGCKEPDPVTAYHFLEMAHDKGMDEHGYCQLGIALLQGNGCPENMDMGKKYLDTAALMGSPLALLNLGVCYLYGYGCETDTTKAMQYLEQAADNGFAKALVLMGDVYQNRDEDKTAVRYYEKAMAQGYVDAICEMGYCYQEGLGVVLNSKKALELYQQAANQGSIRGMMLAANCYLQGIGSEENVGEALKWFKMAAEMGDGQAMYNCYLLLNIDHDSLKANQKEANEWLKKAAGTGYEPAEAEMTKKKRK